MCDRRRLGSAWWAAELDIAGPSDRLGNGYLYIIAQMEGRQKRQINPSDALLGQKRPSAGGLGRSR